MSALVQVGSLRCHILSELLFLNGIKIFVAVEWHSIWIIADYHVFSSVPILTDAFFLHILTFALPSLSISIRVHQYISKWLGWKIRHQKSEKFRIEEYRSEYRSNYKYWEPPKYPGNQRANEKLFFFLWFFLFFSAMNSNNNFFVKLAMNQTKIIHFGGISAGKYQDEKNEKASYTE